MRFKRKPIRKPLSRAEADIIAAKVMVDNKRHGYEAPLKFYDELSDKMCGEQSRKIYGER